MPKIAIALAGLETIKDKDGHPKYFAETFVNNIKTWKKDHQECDVKLIDCRDYREQSSPMTALWADLEDLSALKALDVLMISCHSDWEGLYLFSKYRKELSEEDRYITVERDWSGIKFNPGASIYLCGCQTGGRFGEKWPVCIAQTVADSAKAKVHGYASRTSQRRRDDGGFFQKPDIGGFFEFIPTVKG